MEQTTLGFTAVFLRSAGGYVGFVEELPGVNSQAEELLGGKEALGEPFQVVLPQPGQRR